MPYTPADSDRFDRWAFWNVFEYKAYQVTVSQKRVYDYIFRENLGIYKDYYLKHQICSVGLYFIDT